MLFRLRSLIKLNSSCYNQAASFPVFKMFKRSFQLLIGFCCIFLFEAIVHPHLETTKADYGAANQTNVITREQWGAIKPTKNLTPLNSPVPMVIIAHTVTDVCSDLNSCAPKLRAMQLHHMNINNFDDISYNFLVCSNGTIYEGRGWDYQGAHTLNYNDRSIGIAFIGNYEINEPTKEQINNVQELIDDGVDLGKLSKNYKLYGHRQLRPTKSPGENVYKEIITWAHWTLE